MGFYNIINWPAISVILYNGTSTGNGVLIIITPENSLNQQYEAFSGIGLINNHYFLTNGVIYANGTIYIASLTPVNASIGSGSVSNVISGTGNNSVYGGFEHVVIGGRTYSIGQIRTGQLSSGIRGTSIVNNSTNQVVNATTTPTQFTTSRKSTRALSLRVVLLDFSTITTLLLITMLILTPFIELDSRNYRDCINTSFIGLVRRLGLRNPSLTHRDVGSYLVGNLGINNDAVNRLINYYEVAIYGNGDVNCEEFKELVRTVLNEVRRRS